jgi:hypothetical protein
MAEGWPTAIAEHLRARKVLVRKEVWKELIVALNRALLHLDQMSPFLLL